MTHQTMDGEREKDALIATVKSALEGLTSPERISLAVRIIQDAGLQVRSLKGAYLRNLLVRQSMPPVVLLPDFRVPKWSEVNKVLESREEFELTEVARFVYNEEPAGTVAIQWRNNLQDLITEVYQLGYLEAIKVLQKGTD